MIRQFIRDTIADLAHAVARSELAKEAADLRAGLITREQEVAQLRSRLEAAERKVVDAANRADRSARVAARQALIEVSTRNGYISERDMEEIEEKVFAGWFDPKPVDKAERRGPVDRSAAIEAAREKLEFLSYEEAAEAVDVILGAQKEAPVEKPAADAGKKGVRAAMKMAVEDFGDRGDGLFNLAGFAHALTKLSGFNGGIDGMLCRTILADRDDVESCEPGNPKCAHYRIKKPDAFVPAPTHFSHIEKTLGRVSRELLDSQKRVGELEEKLRESRILSERERGEVAMQRDQLRADLARLSAPCPADGMSDYGVGSVLIEAFDKDPSPHTALGAKARELFGRPAK